MIHQILSLEGQEILFWFLNANKFKAYGFSNVLTATIKLNCLPVFSFLYNVGRIYIIASNMLSLCIHKNKIITMTQYLYSALVLGYMYNLTLSSYWLWLLTQFLSFIFAVLLSITVHFTAFRLGTAIMHQHTKNSAEIVWCKLATMLNF